VAKRTVAVQLRTTALPRGIGTCARRPIDRPVPEPDQRQAHGRPASAGRYPTLSIGPRSWPPRRRIPTQTNPATTRTRASVPPQLRRAPILQASASARSAVARSYSSEASRCARGCTSRTFRRRSARRPHLDCAPSDTSDAQNTTCRRSRARESAVTDRFAREMRRGMPFREGLAKSRREVNATHRFLARNCEEPPSAAILADVFLR
jgi:hypothetical protein